MVYKERYLLKYVLYMLVDGVYSFDIEDGVFRVNIVDGVPRIQC